MMIPVIRFGLGGVDGLPEEKNKTEFINKPTLDLLILEKLGQKNSLLGDTFQSGASAAKHDHDAPSGSAETGQTVQPLKLVSADKLKPIGGQKVETPKGKWINPIATVIGVGTGMGTAAVATIYYVVQGIFTQTWPHFGAIPLWGLAFGGVSAAAYRYRAMKKLRANAPPPPDTCQQLQTVVSEFQQVRQEQADMKHRLEQDLARETTELEVHRQQAKALNQSLIEKGASVSAELSQEKTFQDKRVTFKEKTVRELDELLEMTTAVYEIMELKMKALEFSLEEALADQARKTMLQGKHRIRELNDTISRTSEGKVDGTGVNSQQNQEQQSLESLYQEALVLRELMKCDAQELATQMKVKARIQQRLENNASVPQEVDTPVGEVGEAFASADPLKSKAATQRKSTSESS